MDCGDIERIVRRHFDALSGEYDLKAATRRNYLAAVDRLIVARLQQHDHPLQIVDVGCGTGKRSLGIAQRIGPADLHACDVSGRMVARARANGLCRARQASLLDLPYGDDEFDVALCLFNVIGYLPSRAHVARGLGELHRVLKADGLLFLDAMNCVHLGEGLSYRCSLGRLALRWLSGAAVFGDINSQFFRLDISGTSTVGFVRGFFRHELRREFHKAGFRVESDHIIGYDSGRLHKLCYKGQLFFILGKRNDSQGLNAGDRLARHAPPGTAGQRLMVTSPHARCGRVGRCI